MEILIAIQGLKKNRSQSSAPRVEGARLQSESADTPRPKPLEQSVVKGSGSSYAFNARGTRKP